MAQRIAEKLRHASGTASLGEAEEIAGGILTKFSAALEDETHQQASADQMCNIDIIRSLFSLLRTIASFHKLGGFADQNQNLLYDCANVISLTLQSASDVAAATALMKPDMTSTLFEIVLQPGYNADVRHVGAETLSLLERRVLDHTSALKQFAASFESLLQSASHQKLQGRLALLLKHASDYGNVHCRTSMQVPPPTPTPPTHPPPPVTRHSPTPPPRRAPPERASLRGERGCYVSARRRSRRATADSSATASKRHPVRF